MNNTRKITISIDIEQVLKTVYAESACLALMSGRDSRPAVISSDNRRLLGVYCLNAWLCLAGELASIVDSQSFSIPSDSDTTYTTYTLSLTVDGVGTAQSLRRYAERYVAQSVLASCYAARESLAMQFRDNAARTLSGLRLAATLSDRVDCWL